MGVGLGAVITVVEAVAVIVLSASSVSVRLCDPAVAKVTEKEALPFVNDTSPDDTLLPNVAAVSVHVSVAVPV
jgi:hypothetical protein